MTHQVVYDNKTLKILEETVGHLIDKDPLNYQEDFLSSTDSIAKDTTTDLENKFTSYPEISVESGKQLVGIPAKDDGCNLFADLTNIEQDIEERTLTDISRNIDDGSNIVDVKQILLPNLQALQPYQENDYIQEVSIVDIKDSNHKKNVINYQQNETPKAIDSSSSIMQYKVQTDQVPSTSRQALSTVKMNKGIVSFSSHEQIDDTPTRIIHRDQGQETVSICSSDIGTSKSSFTCAICDKVFVIGRSLRRHMAERHSIGKYKCDLCREVFAFNGDLKIHYMRKHPLGHFVCCGCPEKFLEKDLWKDHQTIYHRMKDWYHSCRICDGNYLLDKKYEKICNKH